MGKLCIIPAGSGHGGVLKKKEGNEGRKGLQRPLVTEEGSPIGRGQGTIRSERFPGGK